MRIEEDVLLMVMMMIVLMMEEMLVLIVVIGPEHRERKTTNSSVLVLVFLWPLQAKILWQNFQKHGFDPRSHAVCGWRAIVDVQNANRDNDRECDECHCKEQILSKEWHGQRSWWNRFSQQEKENGQREED